MLGPFCAGKKCPARSHNEEFEGDIFKIGIFSLEEKDLYDVRCFLMIKSIYCDSFNLETGTEALVLDEATIATRAAGC